MNGSKTVDDLDSSDELPPIFCSYRYEVDFDSADRAEQDITPDLAEQLFRETITRQPGMGELTIREGKSNRAPEQLDLSEIGLFYVVREGKRGRMWIAETTDPDEARDQLEQLHSGFDRIYYEGTLREALNNMLRDKIVPLEG